MILKCLNDEDITIRHRALDLVCSPTLQDCFQTWVLRLSRPFPRKLSGVLEVVRRGGHDRRAIALVWCGRRGEEPCAATEV
eukprot:3743383-Rhodomonas_salina.1